jgi:hypothetical protein
MSWVTVVVNDDKDGEGLKTVDRRVSWGSRIKPVVTAA